MVANRRLKQARELRGWSQAKVAELIATDSTTVSRWERGLFLPTPHFREKLCELFNKNAVELGLVETTQFPHLQNTAESDIGCSHEIVGQLEKAETNDWGETGSLPSRSTPESIDTFTYILQRSSQEQQAYMLWEHAYVQMLQNQRVEAQKLGQASVSVFEQVRHPNAAVVRAWLGQHGLLSNSSRTPDPALSPEHKRPLQPWFRLGGAGVFVVLLLVAGFLLSEVVSNRSDLAKPSATKYPPQLYEESHSAVNIPLPVTVTTQPSSPRPKSVARVVSTPVTSGAPIAPSPTLPPEATVPVNIGITPTPSIFPTVSPTRLNSEACAHDGSGYRCTVTLNVYANANETISWQASANIPAKFNSFTGTVQSGVSSQQIVYIYASCHQSGKLTFAFRDPSSNQTTPVSVLWGC